MVQPKCARVSTGSRRVLFERPCGGSTGPIRETLRRFITPTGPNVYVLDTSGLSAGTYLLVLRADGHAVEQTRFVVVR